MKTLRILVAEDNRGDVLLIRKALQFHNIPHELHLVQDGAEAVGFISGMGKSEGAPCPDLVLLDLNLPKVDGPEVLEAFRKHPECVCRPVIVISSSDSLKDRERMASLDVAHYFKKPSGLDEYMKLGQIILDLIKNSDPPRN